MARLRATDIRRGCEIVLSVISAVLAILFITYIAQIYYSSDGGNMYSRAIVWAKLKYLIAPIIIWIVAVIGCFVLSVLFPYEKRPKKPASAFSRVARLRNKIPAKRDTDGKYINAEHEQYAKLELWRYIAYGIASAFALGVGIYTIVYISLKSNFSSGEINHDILMLVKNVFPFIIASFLLFIGVVIYERVIAKPQLDKMTKILVASKGVSILHSPLAGFLDNVKSLFVKNEDKIVLGTRIAVGVLALAFIIVGFCDGGSGDVLGKAIAICTECIGLG